MAGQHIFISHSSEDERVVSEIRAALQSLGMGVWTDSWRLAGGDELAEKIRQAIESARHFVAVLSTNAVNSRWVAKEVRHALEVQKQRDDKFKVLPILMAGIEPSALPLWFAGETVVRTIRVGPGGIQKAIAELLVALDDRSRNDSSDATQVKQAADLVLELGDPEIDDSESHRRATAVATLTYRPIDGGVPLESRRYPVAVNLDDFDRFELGWYLERYAHWPSAAQQERARKLEKRLPDWGHLLYATLQHEATREPLDAWRAVDRDVPRRLTVLVDPELVEGASTERQHSAREAANALLALPWELVQAERGHPFQRARSVRVRRPAAPSSDSLRPSDPPLRVLLASPRPESASVDPRRIAGPLVETLERLGELARLTLLNPPTFEALEEELERAEASRVRYHLVIFDGNVTFDGAELMVRLEHPADAGRAGGRRAVPIGVDRLAAMLHDHGVPLVMLQADPATKPDQQDLCVTAASQLLAGGVPSVLTLSRPSLAETRRRFFSVFLRELMAGKRVSEAVLGGHRELKTDTWRGDSWNGEIHLQDWFVPVLYQAEHDPVLVTEVSQHRIAETLGRPRPQQVGDLPPLAPHGFVGRGSELLKAEHLLERHGDLVIRGELGEGKTAFVAELVRWLVAGQHFQRAAYVALRPDATSRSVHFSLGEQLVPKFQLAASQSPRLAAQLIERVLSDQPTLLVFDDFETILPLPQESTGDEADAGQAGQAERVFEPRVMEQILALVNHLGQIGRTRLVFVSRDPLPEPFDQHEIVLGRLSNDDGVELLAKVLAADATGPPNDDEGSEEAEVEALVEAAKGHAGNLVLVSGEVAECGVKQATARMTELASELERLGLDTSSEDLKSRHSATLLNAELALRRLPEEDRSRLAPLGVFQGGGQITAISAVLDLDVEEDEEVALAEQLINAGLAEMQPFNSMRLHPGLSSVLRASMDEEELAAAHAAWIDSTIQLVAYLDQQQIKDPKLSSTLTILELPNLLAVLGSLHEDGDPERVLDLANTLERLVELVPRPEALARVQHIRAAATEKLGEWSHGRYEADSAAVEQLLESGRKAEAAAAAHALVQRASASGEDAYPGAAADLAMASFHHGRALYLNDDAEHALAPLDHARRRFRELALNGAEHDALRLAEVSAQTGDCLLALDRPDAAADAYAEAVSVAEEHGDTRRVATVTIQLGDLELELAHPEAAFVAYEKARDLFDQLGDQRAVADAWHRVGAVQEREQDFEAAEMSYHEALKIEVQNDHRSDAAATLAEVAGLYDTMWRLEDAMSYYQQAADLFRDLGDLPKEGIARSNIADKLTKLGRYDEAREEILRTIECEIPYGHEAEPWRTFSMLANLEREAGRPEAAAKARKQALDSYLSYRRDGGASQIGHQEIFAEVERAVSSGKTQAISEQLSGMLGRPDLPMPLKALLPALQEILGGSKERCLAEDSEELYYRDAAELHLLLDRLAAAAAS